MNYWVVRLGQGGEFIKLAKEGKFIAIGWCELKNDLSWILKLDRLQAKVKLVQALKETYGRNYTSGQRSKAAGQILRFLREIKVGDYVFTPDALTRQINIGRVQSGYFYATKKDACRYKHRRKAEWIKEVSRDIFSKPLRNSMGSLLTVFQLSGHDKELSSAIEGKSTKCAINTMYRAQDNEESIVGETINFRGLIFAPVNEQGVVFLFSKVSKDLGIELEEIKQGFPDAIGRVKIPKGYAKRTIEFEFRSSNYDHLPKKANILVCWEHDWKDCPVDIHVIELRGIIKGLGTEE